jgi:hypothetical protein
VLKMLSDENVPPKRGWRSFRGARSFARSRNLCLSVCLSVCQFVRMSFCQSVRPSVCQVVSLFVYDLSCKAHNVNRRARTAAARCHLWRDGKCRTLDCRSLWQTLAACFRSRTSPSKARQIANINFYFLHIP